MDGTWDILLWGCLCELKKCKLPAVAWHHSGNKSSSTSLPGRVLRQSPYRWECRCAVSGPHLRVTVSAFPPILLLFLRRVVSDSLHSSWTAHRLPVLQHLQSFSGFMSIGVCLTMLNHLILCLSSCFPSVFPASRSFKGRSSFSSGSWYLELQL